jgi:hypothetical protein
VTGNLIKWQVKFAGQAAGAVNLDGGNFLSATSDVRKQCSLDFGAYSAPMMATDKAQWTGNAIGVAGYDYLQDLINVHMRDAMETVLKLIEQHVFIGSGTSNQMTGLSTAIASSGAYAGLTDASWVARKDGNSGTLRSLTFNLIRSHLTQIALVSKMGRPDYAFCYSTVFDALEALFTGTIYTQAGMPQASGQVNVPGGVVKTNGFRTLTVPVLGITFIESPDCSNSAETNAANCIYFLNSNSIEIRYLQPTGPSMATRETMQAVQQDFGTLAGLPFDFRPRARTGYKDEFDLTCSLQLVVKDRNANGILCDVQ